MKERLIDVMKWGLIIIIGGAVIYFVSRGREVALVSMIITAIATVAIAYYARKSHELSSKIQAKDDDFKEQVSDLYQAIVISNIVGEGLGAGIDQRIEIFEEKYQGKTKIFKERG